MACSWKPIKIAYDVTEPASGLDDKLAPIILLHGMTRLKEDWENIDQALADATHRKVYKLDARNHGDSEWSEDFDFEILGDDVNHFMETHEIPKAILIGHSMGGRTAMEVAGKHPEKVEKVIIEDMTPLVIDKEFANQMLGLLVAKIKGLSLIPVDADLEQGKTMIKELFLPKIMAIIKESSNERTVEKLDFDIDLVKTKDGFRWKTNYEFFTNPEVISKLFAKGFEGTFDGDILFLCGPKSLFRVADSKDRILEKFPKAIVKEIADATHMVHTEYPEEFVQSSIEFIQG